MEQELEILAAPSVADEKIPEPPQVVGEEAHLIAWLEDTGPAIVRATRTWLQYGALGFAVLCIVIGAVEALMGR